MTLGIYCKSYSGELFITSCTVNYCIVASCLGTCRINLVFYYYVAVNVSELFTFSKSTALTCLGLFTCCICPLKVLASLCNCLFYSTVYANFVFIIFVVANRITNRTRCLLTVDYEIMSESTYVVVVEQLSTTVTLVLLISGSCTRYFLLCNELAITVFNGVVCISCRTLSAEYYVIGNECCRSTGRNNCTVCPRKGRVILAVCPCIVLGGHTDEHGVKVNLCTEYICICVSNTLLAELHLVNTSHGVSCLVTLHDTILRVTVSVNVVLNNTGTVCTLHRYVGVLICKSLYYKGITYPRGCCSACNVLSLIC